MFKSAIKQKPLSIVTLPDLLMCEIIKEIT